MLTLLRLFAFFVGAVLIVTFAVANRDQVVIEFFPLPLAPMQVPIYGLFMAGIVLGALLGAVSLWISALPMRTDWRRLKRQIQLMENQARQEKLREEEIAAQRSKRRKEREDEINDTALPITATISGPTNSLRSGSDL